MNPCGVAQLVERAAVNRENEGSNPFPAEPADTIFRCKVLDLSFTLRACALRQRTFEPSGEATFTCGKRTCIPGAESIVRLGGFAPVAQTMGVCRKHPGGHTHNTGPCDECRRVEKERALVLEAAGPASERASDGHELGRERFAGRCLKHGGAGDVGDCAKCATRRGRYFAHVERQPERRAYRTPYRHHGDCDTAT